jgi:hypothetical protein
MPAIHRRAGRLHIIKSMWFADRHTGDSSPGLIGCE